MRFIPHVLATLITIACIPAFALEVTRFPWNGSSSNLTVGSDGAIWFGTYNGIGRVSSQGAQTIYPIGQNSEFDFIATGSDGNVWSVSRYTNILYAITPSGTVAHQFNLPAEYYGALAPGPDGKMWISSPLENSLISVDTAGHITNYPTQAQVREISTGPDGNMWATVDEQVLRVTTAGAIAPFNMPVEGTYPLSGESIVAGPDGQLWLSANYARCLFDPCVPVGAAFVSVTTSGVATLYPLPGSTTNGATSLAFAADNNPWIIENIFDPTLEYQRPFLVRMTNGVFTTFPIDGDAEWLVRDGQGNLWFADAFNQQIAKVTIVADLVFSDRFDNL